MKDKNNEKQNNPLGAVATGLVIGASIAAAGAVVLQDKNKREKVKKLVNDVKDQVKGYMEDTQKMANEKKEEAQGKVVEKKSEVKKKVADSLDSAQDALEEAKKNL